MKWHFNSGEYTAAGGALEKQTSNDQGAVSSRTLPSDEQQEFRFNIQNQEKEVNFFMVGVADATSEAKLEDGTAAFGAWFQLGQVTACTVANAITVEGFSPGETVRDAAEGEITEIHVTIRDRRLLMTFDDEAPVDLGHDLPATVVPWLFIGDVGDAIEFEEVLRVVPLQVFARAAGARRGSLAITCARIGGEEVGAVGGFFPQDVGASLVTAIHASVPAPPGTQWRLVLPSGELLDEDALLQPLPQLFDLGEPGAAPDILQASPDRGEVVAYGLDLMDQGSAWSAPP